MGIEFCSRWFFQTHCGLVATRDFNKLLNTKQYYNRSNAHILNDPTLHRLAILQGLQSEQASHLLEDIVSVPLLNVSYTTSHEEASRKWWLAKYPPQPT